MLAGLGPTAVTAREGALKLREAARLPAEGFDAEYLLHGNAVPLTADDALIVLGRDADGFLAQLADAGPRARAWRSASWIRRARRRADSSDPADSAAAAAGAGAAPRRADTTPTR